MATTAPNANVTKMAKTPEPAIIAITEKAMVVVTAAQAADQAVAPVAVPVAATHPQARRKALPKSLQGMP